MRLLVVEDDTDLAATLRKSFEEEDFAVDIAADGDDGLFKILHTTYDAVILDAMLPVIDGWSLLKRARTAGVRTPVLMLTARDTTEDRVRGLDLGADDYLGKPFALAELIARVRAMVRRAYGGASSVVTVGDLTIDTGTHAVLRGRERIALTAREYTILELLVRSKGKLVTRSTISDHIYNEESDVASNVVAVHVAALRRKLGTAVIRTCRGEGYVIDG